jgi:hypothetical protein
MYYDSKAEWFIFLIAIVLAAFGLGMGILISYIIR